MNDNMYGKTHDIYLLEEKQFTIAHIHRLIQLRNNQACIDTNNDQTLLSKYNRHSNHSMMMI